jgi:hypothetical protein
MDWTYTGKCTTAIDNQAQNWNPQEQRRRGNPRMSWKKTVIEEAGKSG